MLEKGIKVNNYMEFYSTLNYLNDIIPKDKRRRINFNVNVVLYISKQRVKYKNVSYYEGDYLEFNESGVPLDTSLDMYIGFFNIEPYTALKEVRQLENSLCILNNTAILDILYNNNMLLENINELGLDPKLCIKYTEGSECYKYICSDDTLVIFNNHCTHVSKAGFYGMKDIIAAGFFSYKDGESIFEGDSGTLMKTTPKDTGFLKDKVKKGEFILDYVSKNSVGIASIFRM